MTYILTVRRHIRSPLDWPESKNNHDAWYDDTENIILGLFDDVPAIIEALPEIMEENAFDQCPEYIAYVAMEYLPNSTEVRPFSVRKWNLRGQRLDGFESPYHLENQMHLARKSEEWERWSTYGCETLAEAIEKIEGYIDDGPPYPSWGWRVVNVKGDVVYTVMPETNPFSRKQE